MSIQVGSLLDDGQWHDVEVKRNEENVSLTVDQLTMSNVSTSDFYQLDLDRQVDNLSINTDDIIHVYLFVPIQDSKMQQ